MRAAVLTLVAGLVVAGGIVALSIRRRAEPECASCGRPFFDCLDDPESTCDVDPMEPDEHEAGVPGVWYGGNWTWPPQWATQTNVSEDLRCLCGARLNGTHWCPTNGAQVTYTEMPYRGEVN